jgi:hypothetical protein
MIFLFFFVFPTSFTKILYHSNTIFFTNGYEYMDVGTPTPDMAVLTGVPYSNSVLHLIVRSHLIGTSAHVTQRNDG